jgi:outer membrane protein TolC
MKAYNYIFLLVFCVFFSALQAQKTFTNVNELIDFAKKKNITLQQGAIKIEQAKKAKLAAKVGVFDPTINNSLTVLDNLKQQVNLFPAEIFGGPHGTYKEVTTGTKYVNTVGNTADIKILNLGGWENLRLSKINIESVAGENKMTEKTLFENIASAYFNIVNLQEQAKQNQQNLFAAAQLLSITEEKYKAGIVKQQDVNDAKASYLTTKENTQQLSYLITQNLISLKILCDIPVNEVVNIQPAPLEKSPSLKPAITLNELGMNNSLLKEQYALSNFKQLKKSNLPTASILFNQSYQQNSPQFDLFNGNSKWYYSDYIGLKLNVPLPSAKAITLQNNAQYEYLLAQKNTEHSKIKAALDFQQLGNDYEKAVSQATANQEIYNLRKDTYQRNQQLYSEGLIGIDQTINSFNAMVNANYSLVAAQINVQLALIKIEINNKMK